MGTPTPFWMGLLACGALLGQEAPRTGTPPATGLKQAPGLSALFQALRAAMISDPAEQVGAPIRLYAADESCTKLGYIRKDVIYLFVKGRILRPLYAKAFNIAAINRITYRKSEGGGAFQFWIDDEIALSIGV